MFEDELLESINKKLLGINDLAARRWLLIIISGFVIRLLSRLGKRKRNNDEDLYDQQSQDQDVNVLIFYLVLLIY